MNIAETILLQLGGNRFVAMTGAKMLLALEAGLQFRLPSGAKGGINSVRIELDPSDTYTVTFYKIRGVDVREVKSVACVYAGQLGDVFTAATGLYTSLGTMGRAS